MTTEVTDLAGKVYIVTGGNSGLGYAIVKSLVSRGAKRIYIAARSKERCEAAIEALNTTVDVRWLPLDLSSINGAQKSARELLQVTKEERLDGLVCNAGMAMAPFSLSADGIEIQFAVNCVGHFAFTMELLPLLEQTASQHGEARIVVVGSESYKAVKGIDYELLKKGSDRTGLRDLPAALRR